MRHLNSHPEAGRTGESFCGGVGINEELLKVTGEEKNLILVLRDLKWGKLLITKEAGVIVGVHEDRPINLKKDFMNTKVS